MPDNFHNDLFITIIQLYIMHGDQYLTRFTRYKKHHGWSWIKNCTRQCTDQYPVPRGARNATLNSPTTLSDWLNDSHCVPTTLRYCATTANNSYTIACTQGSKKSKFYFNRNLRDVSSIPLVSEEQLLGFKHARLLCESEQAPFHFYFWF